MRVIATIIQLGLLSSGLSLLLFSLMAERFIEGSPGFGATQVTTVVIAGTLIAGGTLFSLPSVRIRLYRLRRPQDLAIKLSLTLIATVVTIIGLEGTLRLSGYTNEQQTLLRSNHSDISPLWVCDNFGCRFDPRESPNHGPESRLSTINGQGFHDADEFVASDLPGDAFKVLVLGDSFTFGTSADIGQSWVEILERRLSERTSSIVWNTGIPGTGTRHHTSVLSTFYPIMEPDLVILGFFSGNDFDDNLLPMDRYVRTASGKAISQYRLDQRAEPVKVDLNEAFFRAGAEVSRGSTSGRIAAVLTTTIVGGLVWNAALPIVRPIEAEINKVDDEQTQKSIRLTRDFLKQMRDTVDPAGSRFLVMLIPSSADVVSPGTKYNHAVTLFKELEIEAVEPLNFLRSEHYTHTHWNNAGHGLAADAISERVLDILQAEVCREFPQLATARSREQQASICADGS